MSETRVQQSRHHPLCSANVYCVKRALLRPLVAAAGRHIERASQWYPFLDDEEGPFLRSSQLVVGVDDDVPSCKCPFPIQRMLRKERLAVG